MKSSIREMAVCFALMGLLLVLSGHLSGSDTDLLPLGNRNLCHKIGQVQTGKTLCSATGRETDLARIVKENPRTGIFVVGEYHDSYECHEFQRDFIKELYRADPRLIVGFEFFNREDDRFLDMWRLGRITEDELLEKTGWYRRGSLSYAYTRMIMDIIKQNNIKVIGLNVNRSLVHKVASSGLDRLSAEEKALFPYRSRKNTEHRYLISRIFGQAAVRLGAWFERIYSAQTCWDAVMADSMRRVLKKREYRGYRGVIIAGSAHVAYGLGIPFRYRLGDRRARITTVVPVIAEKTGDTPHPMLKMMAAGLPEAGIFSRSLGDYVFAVPQQQGKQLPALDFRVRKADGGVTVIKPGSGTLETDGGLRAGDVIRQINGVNVEKPEQLKALLGDLVWQDEVKIVVERKWKISKNRHRE